MEELTRVDGIDVVDDLTVALFAQGALVLTVRTRNYGYAEELITPAGTVVPGPVSSWTLLDDVLTFEYNARGAAALDLPGIHRLRLDLAEADRSRLALVLLDILAGTCCIVDTPAGRVTE